MGEHNMEVSSVHERSGTSVVDEGCQTSAEIWDIVSSEQQTKSLLELAADNDLEAFKRVVEQNNEKLVGSETWYLRQTGSNQMASEERTPCMIASLYGSLEVLCYILSNPGLHDSHVNGAYGSDQSTALHCAAAGGSPRAVDIVKMLLRRGANKDAVDASGRRPGEVIQVPPKFPHVKMALETMLNGLTLEKSLVHVPDLDGTSNGKLHAPSLSKEEEDFAPTKDDPLLSAPSACSTPDSSPQFSPQFPSSPKYQEMHSVKCYSEGIDKIRDYPADPSIPDIKSSAYTTDEFRMFSFKVRPCSRAYSHDWTECPFVHPGENARRRDPRRYHYSCVPCPDFRKGACRRGDACEYAHGVFECWLHPAQYRTRLCKDGTSCARRVCFFAHTTEELRPLYIAMGSSVPSPRASSPMGSRSISPPLPPGSPAPVLVVPPYSPSAPGNGMATPPLSPSSLSTWSQPSVPSLHLSGGSLHVSRLRAALSARDITLEEYSRNSDYEGNLAPDFSPRSSRSNSAVLAATGGNVSGRMNKFCNLGVSIPQTNLQDMFSSEVVSPMGGVHQFSMSPQERTHLSSQMSQLQLQSQLSSLLSPLSPLSQLQSHAGVQMQNSSGMQCKSPVIFNAGSAHPIIAHRRDLESPVSPCATLSPGTHTAILSQRDKSNWNCKNFVGSLPSPSWSDWGSPSGKPDWGVQGHDLGKFRKSASFASHGGVEPDLSWVHTLVREGQADMEPLVSSSSVASDRMSK